jgi:hypothetical protein
MVSIAAFERLVQINEYRVQSQGTRIELMPMIGVWREALARRIAVEH